MTYIIHYIEWDGRSMTPEEFRRYLDVHFKSSDQIAKWGDISTKFVGEALETLHNLCDNAISAEDISLTEDEIAKLKTLAKLFKEAK